MNALGIYLLMSCLFVVATLIELGVVLEIKRMSEQKNPNLVQPKEYANKWKRAKNENNISKDTDINIKITKLDRIALFSFLGFYLVFNLVYWAKFLM